MYRIRFEMNDEKTDFKSIFSSLHFEKLYFKAVGWTELYNIENSQYTDFFTEDIMMGDEFCEKISKPHYVVMANIGVFKSLGDITEIHTAGDFINSKCKMLITVADSTYTDLFFTDEELFRISLRNIKQTVAKFFVNEEIENDKQIVY